MSIGVSSKLIGVSSLECKVGLLGMLGGSGGMAGGSVGIVGVSGSAVLFLSVIV